MRPDLETDLERRILAGQRPRDAIQAMLTEGSIASAKQAWATLEKWCRKGRYSYGVTLDLGWLVDPATKDIRSRSGAP